MLFLALLTASGTRVTRAGSRTWSGAPGWQHGDCYCIGPGPECRHLPARRTASNAGTADERIALSRHRTGARSTRRKRGLFRRLGIVFPAAVIAIIAVAGVAVGAKALSPGTSATGAVQAIEMVPGSNTMSALEAERDQLVAMTTAARKINPEGTPKVVSASQARAASPSTGGGSSSGNGGGSSGGIVYVTSTPPNPGTAQSIAYNLMSSFGFSPQTYFGCLVDIWNRESGWRYDAENGASGAHGIPQSLPGSKMASAGADWQTNPATQIKWGLGYIKNTYGNPCSAWAFEEANGYY